MNTKGMFYTNESDYENKEDMMNDFIALRMYDMAKDKEIERLHSIIKEVREYIEENMKEYGGDIYITCSEILKILDKEKDI